jgi:hypothetical protein
MLRRRLLLLGPLAAITASADQRTEILEVIEPLAAALSESRSDDFMSVFSADVPGRADLQRHISALIAFAEVTSSIEILRAESGRADLDWYMEIRARATGSVVERRRGTVTIRVSQKKVRELKPVEFFRVPAIA